ncbi:MAG: UDP-forming cellulose synthase catalytic subunit [Candidatus Dactylopiibacterium sp.]|nr:UDP-forming cellulose synthase catalytic subunit [Candidatus Dactylopiibacterium sp.]
MFRHLVIIFAGALALISMGWLASIPLPPELSLHVSVATFAVMWGLSFVPGPVARLSFLVLGAWVVLRYMVWRVISLPLGPEDMIGSVGAVLLLLAECYGVLMLVLGMLINVSPLNRRPLPLPEDRSKWPRVDVFIPTYSEGLDVVKPTVLGALNIDYPSELIRVHVLDDGHPRSLTAKGRDAYELAARTEQLKALCAEFGANYLTRENNLHAKSGNMNSAMQHTSGELILVLDADHVPTPDILLNTVGFFLQDARLAFVQTPHFFINPDPVEKNLDLFNRMPAENDMFYAVVQKGLDLWNTAFFCGSAAVLRRAAIDDVGGFSVDSITEDASTSVKMHARQWNSAYLDIPMVGGLQPESFSGFIVQRMRWAVGMVQIFMRQNPLWTPGLSAGQRLGYLSVVSFWLFPFSRTVFFIAPCLALLFNLKLYPLGYSFFYGYTLPYLIVVVLVFEKLFGHVRRFLTSELYETLQSFFGLPSIIGAALNPKKPSFKVTPKGERHDVEHVSSMAAPFYWVYALSVATVLWGFWRLYSEPDNRFAICLSLGWISFNFLLLNAALGVLVEKVQIRSRPRVPLNELVSLTLPDGTHTSAVVVDANENGALFNIPDRGLVPEFSFEGPGGVPIRARTLLHRWRAAAPGDHPACFEPATPEAERALIAFVYGSSSRWNTMWRSRANNQTPLFSLLVFALIGLKNAQRHLTRWALERGHH